MALSISPINPTIAAQAALLDVALQPGTVVTAQVLKLLDASLVRLAIQSLTLDIATTIPLQPGQTLQLAVTQTKDGLSLTPIRSDPNAVVANQASANPVVANDTLATPRDAAVILDDIPLAPKLFESGLAAPKSPAQVDPARVGLSPVELRAVAVAAQTAVTKQSGLSPLFANLSTAVASGNLPQPVVNAAAQLLALRQPSGKQFSGADLKAAFTASGLLLEPSLAAGLSSPAMPDMKAALVVLRQALATWLGEPASNALAQTKAAVAQPLVASQGDAKSQPAAATMTSTRSPNTPIPTAPQGPAIADSALTQTDIADSAVLVEKLLAASPSANATRGGVRDDPAPLSRNITTPPPFRDASPVAQSVAMPTLARDAEPVVIAQQLIADTDGALARQTLLQIASLPDRVDVAMPRQDATQPRWNFEIPFVTPRGTAMAQFEIARDGSGNDAEAAKRVWRARFSLDIEPAGPVHALISFSGDTTSVKMWAERPATAAQLRANATQLGASLDRADLKAGDIIVADGTPTRAQAPSAGHFLNRAS